MGLEVKTVPEIGYVFHPSEVASFSILVFIWRDGRMTGFARRYIGLLTGRVPSGIRFPILQFLISMQYLNACQPVWGRIRRLNMSRFISVGRYSANSPAIMFNCGR